MRIFIAALIATLFSCQVRAVEIPLNGTVEIVGPWATNQLVTAQIFLSADSLVTTDHFDPINPVGTYSVFAAYTNLSIPGAFLVNGSKVGALGDLETVGGNFAGAVSCTSCSPSADIVWFPDPTVLNHTISTNTNYFIFGPDVVQLEAHLFLTLPDGFSLDTEVAAVPEPSTWAMLLIGFVGLGMMRTFSVRCRIA